MNKIGFIKQILENEKFNISQKERFFNLVSKELENISDTEIGLIKDVAIIKEKLGLNLSEINNVDTVSPYNQEKYKDKDTAPEKKIVKKKYHDPNKVNGWLKYFTKGNTALKFSTHIWDDNLYNSYQEYIDKLNDEFQKYEFHRLQYYNSDLYWNKIYPFVFQKKLTKIQNLGEKSFGWGRHNVQIGWQYPSTVREFCEENFDNRGIQAKTPHTLDIPVELVPMDIPGKTVKTFENLVDLFKPEIEFRDNKLWIGVKLALKKHLPNHNVDETLLKQLKGCSFYTNTEYVLKAISRIFLMIKSRSESQDVNISCFLDNDTQQYILKIVHLNSYSNMEYNHPKLIAEDKGDLSVLKKTLLSLCHFSVESRFKDKSGKSINAKIEYLYDDVDINEWKPNIVPLDNDPEGFKFILKFMI